MANAIGFAYVFHWILVFVPGIRLPLARRRERAGHVVSVTEGAGEFEMFSQSMFRGGIVAVRRLALPGKNLASAIQRPSLIPPRWAVRRSR
jgi:hypothetical protein